MSHATVTPGRRLQPLLHDLSVVVRAPNMVLSEPNGQVGTLGVQGVWMADRRVLSTLRVEVGDGRPEHVAAVWVGPSSVNFIGVCRTIGDDTPDPTVRLERTRVLTEDALHDRIEVVSTARVRADTVVRLHMSADGAELQDVKAGRHHPAVQGTATDRGLDFHMDQDAVTVVCDPQPHRIDASAGTVEWDVALLPATTWTLDVTVRATSATTPPFDAGGTSGTPWTVPTVTSPDPSLPALLSQGFGDLSTLLLRDRGDDFAAAGAPWFLTMFGRDSLWVARLLLPFSTGLAMSTLRALARRQGVTNDSATAQEPGKILHEVRADEFTVADLRLPPEYYGTIDATPLWVLVLVDAWRWGADIDEVRALIPNLRAALEWMQSSARQSPRGFLEYADNGDGGLANQGWKDSGDSVQFADGRLAEAPIALIEPQAYAYEAMRGAADLLHALDHADGGDLRGWADDLATRVRQTFWVADNAGRYPAIAVDRHGQAVDSATSNAGHVLGTGIVTRTEAVEIAARLAHDDLTTRYGLRTLTRNSPRFGLLSYHGGTVWPHDTAVVACGLAKEGLLADATTLALGLVAAGPTFNYRLPELYGVTDTPTVPVSYPAACRPQAWAAAAPIGAIVGALGITANAPGGSVSMPSIVDRRLGGLTIDPILIGDTQLRVSVALDGTVDAHVSGGLVGLSLTPGP